MAFWGVSRILAAIFSLMLVAVEAPAVHQHHDAGPAWYDEECPSVRLAAGPGEPGLLPALDLAQPIPVVDLRVPAPPRGALDISVLSLSTRGPPIAT
ncbi:MAG TPA: hypothetical protein VGW35_18905 [Methylomirabilota bacterium]|jgi:hypothetical protein|nr:hypothetical protein [Methylomirabilota bacterium]